MSLRAAWPHVRAVLVLAHLFAITAAALPAPGQGLKRSAWSDPTVQDEFEAWEQRLEGLGLHFEEGEFEDALWAVAKGWQDAVDGVTVPLRPYYRYCGTAQGWRMFVAPHRNPAILYVEVRGYGQDWHPVFVEGSSAHTWHAREFDHDRARAALFRYAWSSYARYYDDLVDWLAKEAARDFPEASLLRTRWFKYRTLSPEQVRRGDEIEGTFYGGETRVLDDYR